MENSSDFKKKINEIASAKIAVDKDKKSPKEIQEELRKIQEENKKKFRQIKQEFVIPKIKELHDAFQETNDLFQLFSEDQATALQDQVRTFCQIFYFANGSKKFGFNSPSLLFECNPGTGGVIVSQHVESRPARLKEIDKVSVETLNEELISKYIVNFIDQVTKN